jgi:hypothetical protein
MELKKSQQSKNQQTTSLDQSLIKLVKELRTINDFDLDLPQDDIDLILSDPETWAENFSEKVIISFIPKFIRAKRLGKELAGDVLNDQQSSNK